MPELPEVETIRQGLIPAFEGKLIAHVVQRRPDLRYPLPARFAARLKGRRIERLDRRGKYLLGFLDDGFVLVMHLGMSGRFTILMPGVAASPEAPDGLGSPDGSGPHDHIIFKTQKGARIIFTDPRRFGFMDLVPETSLETTGPLKAMGPEPLGNDFSATTLSQALRGKRTPLKAALLDQRVVAGLGNIYVCEALHRAGLSPRRQAATLVSKSAGAPPPTVRAERLTRAIRDVLTEAIAAGGSSLRDYAHTDGGLGYFQHGFAVYDRGGEPCSRAGCRGTIKRIVQSNRSTFYCPQCQR